MIPVIFAHEGNQDYLRIAIEQARRSGNKVVLLGDYDNLYLPADVWSSWEHYKDSTFPEIYRHLSSNHAEFELRCFQRWFAIKRWMKACNIEHIFYCDSDVMLYCDVTQWAESVGNPDVSYQIPKHQPDYRWSASAHVSLWSLAALEEFCDFMLATYTRPSGMALLEQKWQWHRAERKSGGICDMTVLYLWSLETEVLNNAKVINGATFDHNINVSENYEVNEYEMEDGHKRLWLHEDWNDSRPVLWPMGEQREKVFANALHFQSDPTKELMKEYEVGRT